MTLLAPLALVLLALGLSACGGDDDDSAAGGDDAPTPVEQDLSAKPEVEVPDGEPPAQLETTDLVEGDGARAKTGDNVTVQYVGILYDSGEQFDASWDGAGPFSFRLGAGSVIPGWDQGVAGMREGGRRQLVIPPDLAYGAAGFPPVIGPDATLVFVVDLIKVG